LLSATAQAEHAECREPNLISLDPRQTVRLLPRGHVAVGVQAPQIHHGDLVLPAVGYVRRP